MKPMQATSTAAFIEQVEVILSDVEQDGDAAASAEKDEEELVLVECR